MKNTPDIGVKNLEGSALARVDANLQNVANKPLYLVVVEDSTKQSQIKILVTSKVDRNGNWAELIGYETTMAQAKKMKTWSDVTQWAQEAKTDILSFILPSSRVIYIQNVSYKHKVQ